MVRHLDLTIGEEVHFVLIQSVLVVVCLIIEESRLDLRALAVYELNVEKSALSPIVLPRLLVVLLRHPRLNLPIEKERVQTLDRRVALLHRLAS